MEFAVFMRGLVVALCDTRVGDSTGIVAVLAEGPPDRAQRPFADPCEVSASNPSKLFGNL